MDGVNISLVCKRSESNEHFGSLCAVGSGRSGSAVDFPPSAESFSRLICYLVLILSEGQSDAACEPLGPVTFGNLRHIEG